MVLEVAHVYGEGLFVLAEGLTDLALRSREEPSC